MITEKVTEIYQLEFSKRKPGSRFLDGQFSIYKKYFATRDEARAYRKENCREGDGSITKLYAVLEDDGKCSAFAKDAEITSAAEDPDAKRNWIQSYHYFLTKKWAESFRKYPGNLIAVSMCATSSGNEIVITPADYDEKIDSFIYVDNDSNIFFTRDLKLKVTLEKSDLNQTKAVQHPEKSLKALKPVEATVSSSTTQPK